MIDDDATYPSARRQFQLAIALGFVAAILIGACLFFLMLFSVGMRHCSDCDLTMPLLRGFGFALLIALSFGAFVGCFVWWLGRLLRQFMQSRTAFAVQFGATLVGVALSIVPAAYLFLSFDLWESSSDERLPPPIVEAPVPPPPIPVPLRAPEEVRWRDRVETHAENGVAVTSVSTEPVEVPVAPPAPPRR